MVKMGLFGTKRFKISSLNRVIKALIGWVFSFFLIFLGVL